MEAIEGARSATSGPKPENVGPDFHHFGVDELHSLMTVPPQTGNSSFTALLQLPANQAVELLVHSSVPIDTPIPVSGNFSGETYVNHSVHLPPPSMLPPPIFPSDAALIDRAAKYSIFASSENSQGSSCSKKQAVKQEPLDSDSSPTSSDPKPSKKRKDKANKVIESNKKNKKTVNETSTDDDGKLPYVHVRARRGQATDSHSLAERARREKINARMKLLQELVPGCNKISGTASVLDEIINHVQTLQRQVEFLSMRLSTVNPAVDFNIENFLAVENGSGMNNIPSMVMPSLMWNNEGQMNMIRPQYQQIWETDEFNHPINNSLLSYNSPANSASLQSNQLKMEL